jgi:hypothetical protein
VRKVNQKGVFNFYAQRVYVGYNHLNKTLCLRYDRDKKGFILTGPSNHSVGFIQADNFSHEHILNLTVCQNRYIKCQT